MESFSKPVHRIGGNLVSPKPLGSPVVKVTITGRAGSTSATITIVIWTYFIRCSVSNVLA